MARNISQLHPRLQVAVSKLKAQFPNIGIGECFRTVAEQDALYAKGRTAPGNIVTNAKGSTYSSQHQWGIAVDFFKNVAGHEYDDTSFFNAVGAYAKSIGLGWGGDWKNPVDRPHLYLPDWGSTTSTLKSQHGTPDKFIATWCSGTWQQDSVGWWYKFTDGSYPVNKWESINGEWYYFNEKGYAIQNDWKQINGLWYHFDNDCKMQTGWISDGGAWYFLNSEGAMHTGWLNIDGTYYYLDSEGKMKTGWVKVDGAYYYMNREGKMQTGWLEDGGNWYYLSGTGAMLTGLQTINGALYYFAADGHMCRTNSNGALV